MTEGLRDEVWTEPPEYEAGVLTVRQRHSVIFGTRKENGRWNEDFLDGFLENLSTPLTKRINLG
jgi:hypothetical protein